MRRRADEELVGGDNAGAQLAVDESFQAVGGVPEVPVGAKAFDNLCVDALGYDDIQLTFSKG